MIDGILYANTWTTRGIFAIDLDSALVCGEATVLVEWYKEQNPGSDVLNGIAPDRSAGKLYITGKLWPYMFEVEHFPEVSMEVTEMPDSALTPAQ